MARVLAFPTPVRAEYVVLQLALPGRAVEPAGVLVRDPATDAMAVRLRRDWLDVVGNDHLGEAEVLLPLQDDLARKAGEWGGSALLEWLEEHASSTLRVSGREAVEAASLERARDRAYQEHVEAHVLPYETHLPFYRVVPAAGRFGNAQSVDESEPEQWVEVPDDLRLAKGLFVAQVQGRSMEPLIQDGDWCVFRHGVAGTRENRLVLVSEEGGGGGYVVKRYHSEKVAGEDHFAHRRIWLESLNPEFADIELEPEQERYAVIAEFVRVL